MDGRWYRFLYRDGTEFFIDREGMEIWAQWEEPYTIEDMATYLLGPIFGFLLRLRGYVCLHAGAVVVDGKVLALIGPAGAGKSTTSAAMSRLGHRIMTEDVAALLDRGSSFEVIPGYPLIRLWPDSVGMLYGSAEALPPLTPNWDKRYLALDLDQQEFQSEPLPLGAIYFLRERRADIAAPSIEGVQSGAGLIDLVANTYTNYLLDREMRAREFDLLGRLQSIVPLRAVTPQADPARLPDLCRAIIDDYRRLKGGE